MGSYNFEQAKLICFNKYPKYLNKKIIRHVQLTPLKFAVSSCIPIDQDLDIK